MPVLKQLLRVGACLGSSSATCRKSRSLTRTGLALAGLRAHHNMEFPSYLRGRLQATILNSLIDEIP